MSQQGRQRLDNKLVSLGIVVSRSQAESYIKLAKVKVNGYPVTKSGHLVSDHDRIELTQDDQYVGRAGLKLESIANNFGIDFKGARVLDVGSSTGGFTDYALRHGASKVIAVEIGSDQMHPSLRSNPKIELYERTDILTVQPYDSKTSGIKLSFIPNIVVIDLSFISLRQILPHIQKLIDSNTMVVALVKPQFEAQISGLKHKGVIKNEKIRRTIFKEFEAWVSDYFVILNKSDSKISGAKGNLERFYLLNNT